MNRQKIIVAGGGTGGHIFPAIAIANAIRKITPEAEILFVGAKGKMEMEKVPLSGYPIIGLTIAGFNRSSLIKNMLLPFKLLKSFFEVSKIMRQFKPTAVIGVGGYSSFPVLRYAQATGVPTFIHESNSFAGKSNMMLGKKATRIFTATDGMERFFPRDKIIVSGNPVRQSIVNEQITMDTALTHFGLSTNKKTVLCIGGSLGAKHINEAIEKDLSMFEENNLQLIWQTGKLFREKAIEKSKGRGNVVVFDFIAQMEYAYTAADLVISRSGAMSIAELCVVRKPTVFVPYPFAAEDHQTVNAQSLVNKNAALMLKDKDALDKLVPLIVKLAADTTLQDQFKVNMGKLAIRNADEIIAKNILETLA